MHKTAVLGLQTPNMKLSQTFHKLSRNPKPQNPEPSLNRQGFQPYHAQSVPKSEDLEAPLMLVAFGLSRGFYEGSKRALEGARALFLGL